MFPGMDRNGIRRNTININTWLFNIFYFILSYILSYILYFNYYKRPNNVTLLQHVDNINNDNINHHHNINNKNHNDDEHHNEERGDEEEEEGEEGENKDRARDATRLEPQVCFILFFISIY